jgi:hypothetical protein
LIAGLDYDDALADPRPVPSKRRRLVGAKCPRCEVVCHDVEELTTHLLSNHEDFFLASQHDDLDRPEQQAPKQQNSRNVQRTNDEVGNSPFKNIYWHHITVWLSVVLPHLMLLNFE